MANLYSVIPGLQPTQQEILEAELFAKQVLEGKFPDLDLREGTGLRDLVLRPTAYAFALLKKANDYHFAQNTIRGVNEETPPEIVDDILSNWFLERNLGTFAVISARLYFARQKNVTLTSDINFSPDNQLNFLPLEAKVYPAEALEYDSYQNEYYLDVLLQAQDTGLEYNLSQGSLLYFTNFDPYFLHAEINYLVEESRPAETNPEFIRRVKSAISTRNLINIPSIASHLYDTFNYINRIVSIGMGEPEMVRDLISVNFEATVGRRAEDFTPYGTYGSFTVTRHGFAPGQYVRLTEAIPTSYNGDYKVLSVTEDTLNVDVKSLGEMQSFPYISGITYPTYVHSGGKVDIYCGEKTANRLVQFTTDSQGVIELVGPVIQVKKSEVPAGEEPDTMPEDATFTTRSNDLTSHLIQSITPEGDVAKVRIVGHGLKKNRYFTIYDVSPSAYNGTWMIEEVLSGDTFTISLPTPGLGPAEDPMELGWVGRCTRVVPEKDYGFSERQSLLLDFGTENAEKTVSLDIEEFANLNSIQDHLESSSVRVLCADYLARGFNLYRLDVDIVSYEHAAPSTGLIQSTISSFLAKMEPGQVLILSELVAELSSNGITNIKTPVEVKYTKYHRDLVTPEQGTISDYLDPDDRTAIFVLGNVSATTQSI